LVKAFREGKSPLRKSGKLNPAARTELSDFLASVERRAYKQALFAVRDDDAAMDIVQDAMLKLAEKYGDKPAQELPMLFQRILQNTIRDFTAGRRFARCGPPCSRRFHPTTRSHDILETLEVEQGSYSPATPTGVWSNASPCNH
jgi:RNA polymerase sigma-70 factor (ECF subfamily)